MTFRPYPIRLSLDGSAAAENESFQDTVIKGDRSSRYGKSGVTEMRTICRLLVLIAAFSFAGCALGRDWVDITGQKRDNSRAEADHKACVSETPMSSTDRTPIYDETEARRGKLLACMFSHGWRATSLQHL